MARAGEALPVRILGAKGSASVMLKGPGDGAWQSTWIGDAGRGGTVTLPSSAIGAWTLGAAGVAIPKNKNVLDGGVLVLPRVLPRLSVTREKSDGIAPGGHRGPRSRARRRSRPTADRKRGRRGVRQGGRRPSRTIAGPGHAPLAGRAGGHRGPKTSTRTSTATAAFEIERWAAVAKGTSSDPTARLRSRRDGQRGNRQGLSSRSFNPWRAPCTSRATTPNACATLACARRRASRSIPSCSRL
jgi:hypothetical protein